MKQHHLSRRSFLAVCAPLFVSGRVLGLDAATAPSNRLIAGMIGAGNRANDLIGDLTPNGNFCLMGICDCFPEKGIAARDRIRGIYGNDDCILFDRYEEILDRSDFDVVFIAAPDHWHTKLIVESCMAGKDVYSEKPLTLTLQENRIVVAAARKYNRVVTSGSQRVMEDYGYLAPIVQSGRIGEVKEVFCEVGAAGIECTLPPEPVPEGADWDRWLGQAPWAPYNKERCSGNYGGGWRRYREYGNGFLADWGAHKFGGALYAIGLDAEEPVKLLQPRSGENNTDFVTLVYANGVQVHHAPGTDYDITIVGTEGKVKHLDFGVQPLKAVDVRRYHGGAMRIADDFAYSVRNRVRPFQDVLYGARTAAACQIFNIGYRVGRDLVWNAEQCRFEGDDDANRLVRRVQRAPYTIPEV